MEVSISINPSVGEITNFACEVLELGDGIRTIHGLYQDDLSVHIGEMQSIKNLSDPRFVKAQQKYNSLQERVTKWTNPKDRRFAQVFSRMVLSSIAPSFKTDVEELIGKKNIIDSGPFNKFGVVCLKDAAIPNPKPANVVSKKELQEMLSLRKKLISQNPFNRILIEGSAEFRQKTLEDVEKMLTFPEGRELFKRLYAARQNVSILEGEKDRIEIPSDHLEFQIYISHKEFVYLGREGGKQALTKSPTWIVLTHELIHALHCAEDKDGFNKRHNSTKGIPPFWGNREELETIGDPRDIPPISENAFRTRTLFPLRNFHIGRSKNYPTNKKIFFALKYGVDWDLKMLLDQRPPISVEQLKIIAFNEFVQKKQHTLKALLLHPHFKEVQTEEILEGFNNRALNKGWVEILELIVKSKQTD